MGYTSYWAYRPSHPAYAQAWPTVLADTRRIIDRVRQAGIVIAGPDGRRRPILDEVDGIAFNGDASTDLDYETFQLLAPLPPVPAGVPIATGFCTNRNPYDVAVGAVILRCQLLLPGLFRINSDGRWEQEWAHGAMRWSPEQPPGPLNARDLTAELFGAVPTISPFRRIPG